MAAGESGYGAVKSKKSCGKNRNGWIAQPFISQKQKRIERGFYGFPRILADF